jgi:hypothetical protein
MSKLRAADGFIIIELITSVGSHGISTKVPG